MTLQEYLAQHHTDATAKTYHRHIEKFQLRVPTHKKSKYKDILNYLKSYRINHVGLSALKRYYDYLLAQNKRTDHPCKHIKVKTKRSVIQHQNLFTVDELELLLKRECRYKQLALRNKVILGLLIYQGLTIENLIKLKVCDVNLDEATIEVVKCKNLNSRCLELKPKQLIEVFKYINQEQKTDNEYLFQTKLKVKLTVDAIQNIVEQLKPLFLDRKLTCTTIRQSVVANWVNEQGISIEDAQLMSGHKWMSTTEQYKREGREHKKEMINKYFPI